MDSIVKWSSKDRADLFREAATQKSVVPGIVEKDFWVCWTLGKLFLSQAYHNQIILKGGTSLSKVFKLIDRFSEDIDLILHWDLITAEDPTRERSRTKQQRINDELNYAAQNYLRESFLPELERMLDAICIPWIDKTTPQTINIHYPASFNEEYLRPEILLEIGPLAAWSPNDEYEITSYAAEGFPDVFSNPTCKVRAIKAERTFWEKATILHHEAHRSENSPIPDRYSRHYYDLRTMAGFPLKDQALADLDLLNDVVRFKDKFYYRKWARYDLARPGTMKLLPTDRVRKELRKDYLTMRNMFFGNPPSFEDIVDSIKTLEDEINLISPNLHQFEDQK